MKIKLFIISLFIISVSSKNRLYPNECLNMKDSLVSENGCFKLIMQEDGNLVIYRKSDGIPIWNTATYLSCSYIVCYRADGNLVVSNCEREATWVAGAFAGGHYVELQNDGNLVNYADNPLRPVWASNSVSQC